MEESKCDDKSSEDASVTYWDIEIEELPVEKQEAVSDVQGMNMTVQEGYPDPPETTASSGDAILSNVVLNCWKKYLR